MNSVPDLVNESRESGPPAKRRKCWLQYSLRGFLVLVAAFCACLAYVRHVVHRDYAAVTELARCGYTFFYFDDAGISYDTRHAPRRNANVLDSLNSRIDAALRSLGPEWEHFGLNVNAAATSDSRADDVTLLLDIVRLKGVVLRGPAIGDEELRQLVAQNRLESIYLDRCGLTDGGVAVLKGHDEIRRLGYRNTVMTDDAIIALYQALPKCYVRFDTLPSDTASED